MVQVYDRQTLKWINREDENITEDVATGKISFQKGVRIPIVTPEGETGTIDSDESAEAFQAGYRYRTVAEAKEQYKKEIAEIRDTEKAESNKNMQTMGMAIALVFVVVILSDCIYNFLRSVFAPDTKAAFRQNFSNIRFPVYLVLGVAFIILTLL